MIRDFVQVSAPLLRAWLDAAPARARAPRIRTCMRAAAPGIAP